VIALLVVLLIIGVVMAFLPIDPGIRNVIVAVVAVCALFVVLSLFGLLPALRVR
jgi:hypothetical protein